MTHIEGIYRDHKLTAESWPAERIAKFRTLWLDGKTCSVIALEVGMPRASVPARAKKLGLPGRGSPLKPALNLTREQRRERDAAFARDRYQRRKSGKQKRAPKLVVDNAQPKPRRVPRMPVDLAPSRNLLVGELSRELCGFPTSTEAGPTHSGLFGRYWRDASFSPPRLELPPANDCEKCGGRERLHDCPSCRCSCEVCHSKKPDSDLSIGMRGGTFRGDLVRRVLTLPGVMFADTVDAKNWEPISFKFAEGGQGLLMPFRDRMARHVEEPSDQPKPAIEGLA